MVFHLPHCLQILAGSVICLFKSPLKGIIIIKWGKELSWQGSCSFAACINCLVLLIHPEISFHPGLAQIAASLMKLVVRTDCFS
jgi:hypothetical protein